jgi:hypothetical protein
VDKLPKTADGVTGSDMMKVWKYVGGRVEDGTVAMRVNYEGGWDGLCSWYSTREAAEAAAKEKDND